MEDAKRQTLARIVRAGAEEMLPRQLALLEQICAIDSGTGAFAAASAPEAISFAVCVLTAPNSLNVLFFTPRSRRFA